MESEPKGISKSSSLGAFGIESLLITSQLSIQSTTLQKVYPIIGQLGPCGPQFPRLCARYWDQEINSSQLCLQGLHRGLLESPLCRNLSTSMLFMSIAFVPSFIHSTNIE